MRVKVQRYISLWGEIRWGIYVKRWWFPFWVRVDYWESKGPALHHAETIKHPQITEIT